MVFGVGCGSHSLVLRNHGSKLLEEQQEEA